METKAALQAPPIPQGWVFDVHADTVVTVTISLMLAVAGGIWAITQRMAHNNNQVKSNLNSLQMSILTARQDADKASLENKYMIMLAHKDDQTFRTYITHRIQELEKELALLKAGAMDIPES